MDYKIISTEEMDLLLDSCVRYLLNKFKNEQAAEHLLSGVSEIYDTLESNPNVYRVSQDSFMKALECQRLRCLGWIT